ncbi:MAG TPA: trypsin-like peptidase domain-containing protein [Verrucomicrobiae bacterium]|nr:trypsin-like peptidase domain-containing protein [Verrucomicrobiae bacterium]
MRALRLFLWATALVTVYIVGYYNFGHLLPQRKPSGVWTEPAAAAATNTYSPDEQNNIEIYKAAREATVNITSRVYVQNWFLQVYPQQGTGSGFILNADGEILTNYHVVKGASQLTVKLTDQSVHKARVLGTDSSNDLALVKIDAGRKLPTLRLGDSDGLVVGQKVEAIGNPFGFDGTLTTGIVSSLGRDISTEDEDLRGMIQTDAAINPGNSGGPLLDSHGNVIGINTAIYGQGNVGIGFAMPINRAKTMLEEFQARGRVAVPWLGIKEVWISGDLAEELRLPSKGGLLIQNVENGSPADDAGLHGPTRVVIVGGTYQLGIGGDLIVAVDGQAVDNADVLRKVMNRKRSGEYLSLMVYRGGRNAEVKVKLGEAPQRM